MNHTLPKSLHHIRESIMLLIFKIFFAFLCIEGIYFVALLVLSLDQFQVEQYYDTILYSFTIAFVFKSFLLLCVLLFIILRWTTTVYYISERQLILHKGVIDLDEDAYELNHIRAVKLHQSLIGKIFNYGTIVVTIAVSGYHENRILSGISDPSKYEHILREHISPQQGFSNREAAPVSV